MKRLGGNQLLGDLQFPQPLQARSEGKGRGKGKHRKNTEQHLFGGIYFSRRRDVLGILFPQKWNGEMSSRVSKNATTKP